MVTQTDRDDCKIDCTSNKCTCNFDLVYIELTDIQKNLDKSSKNLSTQRKKIREIFKELRKFLPYRKR